MSQTAELNDVIDQIAEIVRRVGKRDEIEDEIAENVHFSELVTELIKQDGPVRDMAVKAVTTHLKDISIDSDSETANEILEAIDFKKLVPEILITDKAKKVISEVIENSIENGDIDFESAVTDAIDSKQIKALLDREQVQKTFSDKTIDYLKILDLADLGEITQTIHEVAFSKEQLEKSLAQRKDDLDELIYDSVKGLVEQDASWDSPLGEAIAESKTFQASIDKAVVALVSSGRMDTLVEKVATSMLSSNDSEMRSKLTNAISDKLVSKIAGNLVGRLLQS
jgi:hypothetical protein